MFLLYILTVVGAVNIDLPFLSRETMVANAIDWLYPSVVYNATEFHSLAIMEQYHFSPVYSSSFTYPHTQLGLLSWVWQLPHSAEHSTVLWKYMTAIAVDDLLPGDLITDRDFYPRLFMGWVTSHRQRYWTIELSRDIGKTTYHSVPFVASVANSYQNVIEN